MNKAKIMVVEDEAIVGKEIEIILNSLGYQLVGTSDAGEKAIEMAEQQQPDLVLMDIRLSGTMDGIEAARIIQERFQIPTVFLTSHADDKTLKRAQEVSPLGYLVKPLQQQELKATLHLAVYAADANRKRIEAERKREEYESRFKSSFEASAVGMAIVDDTGQILSINDSAAANLGYTRRELLSRSFFDITHEADLSANLAQFRQAVEEGRSITVEKRYVAKDGSTRYGKTTLSPITNQDGQFLYGVVHMQDITDKKLAQEQTQFQTHILNAVRQAVIVTDRNSQVVYWNPFAETLYGWKTEEAKGKKTIDLIASEDAVSDGKKIMQEVLSGKSWSGEYVARHKSGTLLPVHANLSPIFNENGKLTHVIGISFNISDRKASEEKIRQIAHQLGERIKELNCLYNISNIIETPDLSLPEIFQKTVNVIPGSFPDPELTNACLIFDQQRYCSKQFQESSWKISSPITVNAQPRGALEVHCLENQAGSEGTPFSIEEGKLIDEIAAKLSRLISNHESEAQRLESELKYRSLTDDVVDSSDVGIFILGANYQVVWLNNAIEHYFGLKREEVIGKDKRKLLEEKMGPLVENAERYQDLLITAYKAQTELDKIECHILGNDKVSERWLEHRSKPITSGLYAGGRIEHYYDITERKKIRTALQENLILKEKILEFSPLGMAIFDGSGQCIIVNQALAELIGGTKEQLQSQNLHHIESWKDSGLYAAAQKALIQKETVTIDISITTSFDVKLELTCYLTPFSIDYTPHLLLMAQDISEPVKAQKELDKINRELIASKQLAESANQAKSEFLANMSHELRTPLNAILGFTHLIQRDENLPPGQKKNADIIIRSGEHLLALINDILEMTKIETGKIDLTEGQFDLWRLLETIHQMMQVKTNQKQIELKLERSEQLPQIIITDEAKLRQVLMNLLSNAIKFTREGTITLKASLLETVKEEDGESAVLQFDVEDTGVGVESDELNMLFDAFYQVQRTGAGSEGTGLGLSISRKYIQLMGGDITVHSKVGKGSVFSFTIQPRLSVAALSSDHELERKVIGFEPYLHSDADKPYRILVADDKLEHREILVELLEEYGLALEEAENGMEAVERSQAFRPDLIIMDISMPVMNGIEASRRIKSSPDGKDIIIVAFTANVFEEDRKKIRDAGCDDFLMKPIQLEELFKVLAKHLKLQLTYEEPDENHDGIEWYIQNPEETAPLLKEVPEELLKHLEQASATLNIDDVSRLIAEIKESNSLVAAILERYADDYKYAEIWNLIQQSAGSP